MNKKILPVIILALFLVIGLGVFWLTKKSARPLDEKEEPKVVLEQFNNLPVKDRPYFVLRPSASGGEVYFSIDRSTDRLLEYEIEYQAINEQGGTLLQGGAGRLELDKQSQPTEPKEFCFCSESKGKKKYDTGVTGGSIILRFSGGDKNDYSLKDSFTLNFNEEEKGVFSSHDSQAKIVLAENDLPDDAVIVATNTFGLPMDIEGELLAGPYGFFTAEGIRTKLNEAVLTIKSKQDLTMAAIFGWNEETGKWQKFEEAAAFDDGSISATVPFLGTYILVKSE